MIHYIKGKLAMKMEDTAIVETGGIGYEISVPANSAIYLAKDGDDVVVYTTMIVREDDISLYGFADRESLELFKKLITVSGVGAKAAMAILSAMTVNQIKQAIVFEDSKSLTEANGVGKKTAQRIVLELKDKFAESEIEGELPSSASDRADQIMGTDEKSSAVKGLVALGYSRGEAVNALSAVKDKDLTADQYIKEALKKLF